MKIDLHIHSKNSDGVLSPEEIFQKAKKNNISMISITDHDYIENYSDLASKYDISTVTGIEFNTSYKKMHILGYGIEDIQLVKKIMNELAMYNEDVVLKVIQMLERDGFNISRSKIIAFCKENNMKHEFLDKKILVKYLIN